MEIDVIEDLTDPSYPNIMVVLMFPELLDEAECVEDIQRVEIFCLN